MSTYKELFYKSQAEIANAIDSIEEILSNLKRCMKECEDDIGTLPPKSICINISNRDNEKNS